MFLKNTSGQSVCAQLIAKADGTDVTTGTTTVYVTGDAGTQASGSGTVTHEGQGTWSYVPTQGETNYDEVAYTFVNTNAVSVAVNVFPTVLNDIADAILARDIGSGSNAGTSEERTVRSALRKMRNKDSLSGSTGTVTKEDDSTAAWTYAVTVNASADPITAIDPT